jgi:hypothetical protein
MQLHQCPDLTVLGASPPVKGQVQCSTLEHSGNHRTFRLTGQLALLRYHWPLLENATSSISRFDGIGLKPVSLIDHVLQLPNVRVGEEPSRDEIGQLD